MGVLLSFLGGNGAAASSTTQDQRSGRRESLHTMGKVSSRRIRTGAPFMDTQMHSAAEVDFLRTIVQESLARNHHLLRRHAAGLTHEESLLQPQPRGNCFNWVVGHMAETQESMLAVVGGEPVFPADR